MRFLASLPASAFFACWIFAYSPRLHFPDLTVRCQVQVQNTLLSPSGAICHAVDSIQVQITHNHTHNNKDTVVVNSSQYKKIKKK